MTGTPLLLGEEQRAALLKLKDLALAHPVDVRGLVDRLKDPATKRRHMDHMGRQTVIIPIDFAVTLSYEIGHPCGMARHMSMSSAARGRVPNPIGVWMVAEQLGFVGSLSLCQVYMEELRRPNGNAQAVNILQPVTAVALIDSPQQQ